MNFSIMSYVDSFIDNVASRRGFIKAGDIPHSAMALFAGEATPQSYFVSQTEEEIQKLAVTNSSVYSNIQLISRRISMGIMKVQQQQQDGIWKDDPTHDFTKLVEHRPNPFMGQAFIWEYQMFWLLLRGEMYWLLAPDDGGELQQMYPLPAGRIYPEPDPEKFIRGYWYHGTATGKPEFLETNQVCFIRLPNPFNYHRGLSPLTAFTLGLQIDRAAQVFTRDDYKDGLTLQHIISLRPEISDIDAMRYTKELDDGQKAKRRYLVTRGGDIDVKPLQARKQGSEDNVRKVIQEDADRIYGIPEGLRSLSATQLGSGANHETAPERIFINDTIWPLMELISQDMTVQIVNRYYEDNERCVFEDIRIRDIERKMATEAHKREVQTLDEARKDQELDPYPDPEMGIQKFTSVDKLIELKYEASLVPEVVEPEKIASTQEVVEPEEVVQSKSLWSEIDYWRNGKNSIVDLESSP